MSASTPVPDLHHLLATTDRAALLELIIASYAAWETHYSGGYLYTNEPTAVALFEQAREHYRAWRTAKVEDGVTLERQLHASHELRQRLRALMPDVTYPETVLLEAAHGLEVDDATAIAWLVAYRKRQVEADALDALFRSAT